jgi:hypothetical protein
VKNKIFPLVSALLAALCAAVSVWGFTYITDQRTSGTPLPLKWPPGSVAIQIKLGSNANLSDGTSYNTSAQAAAQMWNTNLGNLQITTSFAPEGPADENNNLNELVFASNIFGKAFDGNTVAVTTTWSRGNERTRADIIFNSARTWDSYDGPTRSAIDLQRVTLHELGHLLGLDHPDEAGQTVQAIMNSRISGLDSLASDDITGVQNLYGPPGAPANDSFANAATITLPATNTATLSGYNTNATKQVGEPNHADNAGGRSVWWRWTAPAAGPVTIDLKGSYFDTTLGVYTGTAVNALTTIASNDDLSASPHIQASSVTFTAIAGTTYFIAVDGFDADCAGVTLNLSFSPTGPLLPVITSQPVSATVTSGGSASFSVTATGATGYQWTFNGNNISGATGASYTLSSVTAANAGSYRVVVSNAAGSLNSDTATLTVNAPPAPPAPPPSSGGGGGGGGAPSFWFYGALGLLGLARLMLRRR